MDNMTHKTTGTENECAMCIGFGPCTCTTWEEDAYDPMNDGRTFRVTSETRRRGIWGGTEHIIQEVSGGDLEGKFYEITRKALTAQMMHTITWLDEGQSVTVSDWDGMTHTITRIS